MRKYYNEFALCSLYPDVNGSAGRYLTPTAAAVDVGGRGSDADSERNRRFSIDDFNSLKQQKRKKRMRFFRRKEPVVGRGRSLTPELGLATVAAATTTTTTNCYTQTTPEERKANAAADSSQAGEGFRTSRNDHWRRQQQLERTDGDGAEAADDDDEVDGDTDSEFEVVRPLIHHQGQISDAAAKPDITITVSDCSTHLLVAVLCAPLHKKGLSVVSCYLRERPISAATVFLVGWQSRRRPSLHE